MIYLDSDDDLVFDLTLLSWSYQENKEMEDHKAYTDVNFYFSGAHNGAELKFKRWSEIVTQLEEDWECLQLLLGLILFQQLCWNMSV